jgi:hypothetical protein
MHRAIHGILYDGAVRRPIEGGPNLSFPDDNPPTLSFRAEREIFIDARYKLAIQSEPRAPPGLS